MNPIKKLSPWVALAVLAFIYPARATDLRIINAYGYSWSGLYSRTAGSRSYMYPNGLGSGYYRYGSLYGTIRNYSSWRSGSVCGNLLVCNYRGASSGYTTFSANWGGNSSFVFYQYQAWTSTRYGYRKRLYRYGYPAFTAYEWTGYKWAARSTRWASTYPYGYTYW